MTVVEVDGLLDDVLVDFVEDQVRESLPGQCAVVLQLDSGGAVVSDGRLDDLIATIEGSDTPVDVWVGPSGSRATEEAVRLLAAADVTGLAPGSSVEVTPALLDARGVAAADLGDVDVGDRVGAERALDLDLVDNDAPVIGEFVLGLPGVESEAANGGRRPVTDVRFTGIDIVGQLMHTVSSPPVAYLLFVIGLALLVFELYTAGVGVAGVAGAGALLLGCYGLAALPTQPVGVALLLFAFFAYAVDVQTGVPRVWTGIGTVAFVLGSLVLYDGVSVSWVTLLVAFVGHHADDAGGDADDGAHPVLHADHRPGLDDRRDRHRADRRRPRRRGRDSRRSVACPHEPCDAPEAGRPGARGVHRRVAARGRARRGRRPSTTASAIGPPTDPSRSPDLGLGLQLIVGAMIGLIDLLGSGSRAAEPP